MSPTHATVIHNRIPRLVTASAAECTSGIGRGTGMTIREFKKRLNDYMARKGIAPAPVPWDPRRRPHRGLTPVVSRIRKNDPWSQL